MANWVASSVFVICLISLSSTQYQTALPWYYQTSGTRAPPWYLRGSSNVIGNGGFVQRPPVFDRPVPLTDFQSIVDRPVNNDVSSLLSNLQDTFGNLANNVIGSLTTAQPTGLPLAPARFNGGVSGQSSDVRTAFMRSGIVPNMMRQPPRDLMQVFYSNGNRLSLGNELRPSETSLAPSYISFPSNTQKYYTLVMMDTSPSGSYRGIMHWLVVNIPGSNVRRGDTIVEYAPSRPYLGASGLHNYAFVAYEQNAFITSYQQPSRISANELFGRRDFDLSGFLRNANIIEPPVAGNYYVAQGNN